MLNPPFNVARKQAKIQADKELALRELDLKAQAQTTTSDASGPPPRERVAKSTKLSAFLDEKD